MRVNLTDEQRDAVATLLGRDRNTRVSRISSLSGPAGSGKTTLLSELVRRLSSPVVVVPTRQAARVLGSKGVKANTYHSVFFTPKTDLGRLTFVPNNEVGGLSAGKLDYADTIVVDEASMVGQWYIEKMLEMCRHLILVGDGNQLPPVNDKRCPRGFFNSLNHSATLTSIHRQAEGSAILASARAVACGERIDFSAFEPDVAAPGKRINDLIGELVDDDKSWCVVAWTNNMVNRINRRVRHIRGCADENCPQSGQHLPQPGEFMLCRSNIGDLENGQTVYIHSVDFVSGCIPSLMKKLGSAPTANPELSREIFLHLLPKFVAVDEFTGQEVDGRLDLYEYMKTYFPDHPSVKDIDRLITAASNGRPLLEPAIKLEFAYARTVHKAQGSEFDTVIMIDQKEQLWGAASKEWHKGMDDGLDPDLLITPEEVQKRWVYTAMTRAANRLVVWPRKIDNVRIVL